MSINTIFAVDPGNVAGWAYIPVDADPKPKEIGKTEFSKSPLISAAGCIEFFCTLSINNPEYERHFHVVIEGQYLDEGSKRNIDSLIKLARKAGRWEEAACAHGLTYEYIQPSMWISAELGRRLRHNQIAKLAKQKCEALYGVKGLSEHEHCAILIGRYVAIREWRKSLQATEKSKE